MHFTDRIHLVSIKCLLPFLVLIRILQDPMLGIYPSWEVNRRERERIWIGCCVLSESVNYIEGFEVARKAVIMYYASLLFKWCWYNDPYYSSFFSFLYCYTYCLIHFRQFIVQIHVCVIRFYLHVPLQMVWKMRCYIISTNTKVA